MADLVITAANVVTVSGPHEVGTAGEALTAGQAVYKKTADSKIWKAKASGTAEEADVKGIALHAAGVNQPVIYQTDGSLNIGATTAKTTHYVLSAVAGGIAPQADLVGGNRIVFLGYATDITGTFVFHRKGTGATV